MYSLVESGKVTGVDPVAYLVDVATRAKRDPTAVLLPGDFKLSNPASQPDVLVPV